MTHYKSALSYYKKKSPLINEQNNRSLFVLTTVTVLALPINIIAGLLGMNVGGIPLQIVMQVFG
jgi:Mg2+ and Co2+ transporter CorA